MAYVGTPIDTRNQFQSLQGKRFDGDGSTTAFTLDVAPSSTLDIEVFVGNVRQDPNSAYTLSGTTLTFTGAPPSGTNNIYVVHQAKSVGTIDVPSGGVQSGSLASAFLTGQTDIGAAIADTDLFLIDDGAGGTLRKTAASRIKTYTASAGIDDQSSSNDDQLTIKDGEVIINEDSDDVDFRVETDGQTHALFVRGQADGRVSINESSADVGDGGLCLNQTSDDNNIFTLKSNDVAHGMTDQEETDTYFAIKKRSATDGGSQISTYAEGDQGFRFIAAVNNDNTTQNATGNGAFHFQASKKTSNTYTTMGANGNLIVVSNNGATRFIVDEDGDVLHDGSTSAYDSYNDAHLVRAMDLERADPATIINSKWDKFVDYNFDDLKKSGIFGNQSEEDYKAGKKPFIKMGALQRLHNGAIWQQYEKHQQLLEAVYDLAKEAVGEEKANAILEKHEVKRLQ